MLISCPECHQKISDQSNQCIHCGCPVKKDEPKIYIVNGTEYNFTEILSSINDSNVAPAVCIRTISDLCGIPIFEAKEIYFKIKNGDVERVINCEIKESSNIPKCPTCSSTNITRISTTAKVTNAVMFGLLGNKRKKTFHCNSCKYEW